MIYCIWPTVPEQVKTLQEPVIKWHMRDRGTCGRQSKPSLCLPTTNNTRKNRTLSTTLEEQQPLEWITHSHCAFRKWHFSFNHALFSAAFFECILYYSSVRKTQ